MEFMQVSASVCMSSACARGTGIHIAGYAGSMRNTMWEPVISAMLGAAGIGPAILAFFENGSFEEYIEGGALKVCLSAARSDLQELFALLHRRVFHHKALATLASMGAA